MIDILSMIRNLLIFYIYLHISDVQGRIFSLARDKHLNVWIQYTLLPVRGNCSKPKIGAFPGALRLLELVHVYGGLEGGHRLDLLSSAQSVYDQGLNPVCR